MDNYPKNWKWMVPGAFFPLFMLLTRSMFQSAREWVQWGGFVPGFIALLCAVAAVSNFFIYLRDQNTSFIERKYYVLSQTSTAVELKNAQHVHPEVARMIFNERSRIWALKAGDPDVGIEPHSVLFDAQNVTDSFFIYFLKNSSDARVMPQHGKIVEGRKNYFDPYGKVDEYTMYKDVINLLARKRIIVQWSEFGAWEWAHPWGPGLVAANWGFELDDESKKEVEPLTPLATQPEKRNLEGKAKAQVQEKDLTEADLKNIEDLQAVHKSALENADQKKYSLTLNEYLKSRTNNQYYKKEK